MCGLVGIAGEINLAERKMFTKLLILDTIRGPHSTGVAVVNEKGKTKVYKALDTPFQFFQRHQKVFNRGLAPADSKVLIGHNRYATVGEINVKNAHPFIHGHIVGAHNGTLNKNQMHELKNNDKFEVDSQVMFDNIREDGLEETYKRLNGAWAMTYYDTRKGLVNIIRNYQRPLSIATMNNGRTRVWASERWMLEVASDMCNKQLADVESIDCNKLHTINPRNGDMKIGKYLNNFAPVTYTTNAKYTNTPWKEDYKPREGRKYIPFYVSEYDEKADIFFGWALAEDDDGVETPIKIFAKARDRDWVEKFKNITEDYQHWFVGEVIDISDRNKAKESDDLILSTSISEPFTWDEWSVDFTVEKYLEKYKSFFQHLRDKKGGEVVVPFPKKTKTIRQLIKKMKPNMIKTMLH